MPVSARPASSTPSQAASVKAVSVGAKKNRLGELLNGTALVKSGTGRSPCSPSRGLNSNAALRKASRRIRARHGWSAWRLGQKVSELIQRIVRHTIVAPGFWGREWRWGGGSAEGAHDAGKVLFNRQQNEARRSPGFALTTARIGLPIYGAALGIPAGA